MTNFGIRLKNKLKCENATLLGILSLSAAVFLVSFGMVGAEMGVGTDIFKAVLTIMGADKAESGDVVALVTVNDHSIVRNLIEYVATFPNVTVNSGDKYDSCVLPLKSLKIVCVEGHNSPAKRPEFVDLSLISTNTSTHDISSGNSSATNQSALLSSGFDSDGSTDSEKQHKKKKSDKGDETPSSDINPAFNIEQNP